jgi:hypothetical protein
VQLVGALEALVVEVEEYESFIRNSRPRRIPARGRASSRYLFWI